MSIDYILSMVNNDDATETEFLEWHEQVKYGIDDVESALVLLSSHMYDVLKQTGRDASNFSREEYACRLLRMTSIIISSRFPGTLLSVPTCLDTMVRIFAQSDTLSPRTRLLAYSIRLLFTWSFPIESGCKDMSDLHINTMLIEANELRLNATSAHAEELGCFKRILSQMDQLVLTNRTLMTLDQLMQKDKPGQTALSTSGLLFNLSRCSLFCDKCAKTCINTVDLQTFPCSFCNKAYYCSFKCQLAAKQEHSKFCTPVFVTKDWENKDCHGNLVPEAGVNLRPNYYATNALSMTRLTMLT